MKSQQLFAILLAGASLVIASCGKDEHTSGQSTGSGPQQQTPATGQAAPVQPPPPAGEAVEPQATDGSPPTGAPAAQSAPAAQQEVVAELQNLQAKIDALEQQASQASEREKSFLVSQVEFLKQQREALEVKAQQTAASGVKMVNDLLTKVSERLDVLSRSVEPEEASSGAAAPAETPK